MGKKDQIQILALNMENGSTSMLTVNFVELKCLSDGFTRKKVKEDV